MQARILRRASAVVVTTVLVAAMALPALAGGSGRFTLGGNVPRWATTANLKGPASGSMEIHVVLGWRNTAALGSLLRAVTTPGSGSYRQYLSAAQFHQRFSPSGADAAKVSSWLRSQGLKVTGSPASKLWVEASGSVAQLQKAFATKINVYDNRGTLSRAPATNPSVPASLKGVVRGVTGLGRPAGPPHEAGAAATVVHGGDAVLGLLVGEDREQQAAGVRAVPAVHGLWLHAAAGPERVRHRPTRSTMATTAAGVTVAVLDAWWNPTLVADLQEYSSNHGLPAPNITLKKFTPYKGDDALQQGWYGEQALDVDAVHSMAPGADILYVGAKNNTSNQLNKAMAYVLDNEAADLTTNSYGYAGESLPQDVIDESEALYQQAAGEGIGTYFSSGDSGDEIANLGYRTTDYSASSPWVTAVGGTSLGVGPTGDYIFETGWGTSLSNLAGGDWDPAPPGDYLYGGGGGTSRIFGEPWYQVGVVPTDLSGYWGGAGRVVPDVAALGDPNTGFTIGITQTFPDNSVKYAEYRIGGTSLSSPLMAGIMAVAQDKADAQLGFINPTLYSAYWNDPSIVRDIIDPLHTVAVVRTNWVGNDPGSGQKTFSLRTMNTTGTLHTIVGYDDVTGVGTPYGEAYLDAFGT